jgi:hypothetical protein
MAVQNRGLSMDHIQLSKGLSCIRGLIVFSPAEQVNRTRRQGATDREIQDSVLIAATYRYDRYVEMYCEHGRRLPEEGFVRSTTCLPVVEKWVEKEYV